MAGGVEDVINVLSSLAGVLIEGQHSSEAQREAIALFDRCEVWSSQQQLLVPTSLLPLHAWLWCCVFERVGLLDTP